MKTLVALAAAAITLGATAPAQETARQNSLCYMGCQYECYAQYPGGGPQWQQCYLTCIRDRCGAP